MDYCLPGVSESCTNMEQSVFDFGGKEKYNFQLEPNEEYRERCGEVFLTNIGYLLFHCTLCDMKYKGFERFADHVRDEHLFPSNFSDNFLDSELAAPNLDNENASLDSPDGHVDKEEENNVIEERVALEIVNDDISNDIQDLRDYSEIDNTLLRNELSSYDQEPTIIEMRPLRRRYLPNSSMEGRKYKCPICDKAFKDKHNQKHHVLRHTNIKNYQCSHCEKRFYTSAERRVHLRIHNQVRPFLCSECGLSFSTNVHLVNHIKRHKNQRDYQCPHCDKAFFEQFKLTNHLYTHKNEKRYNCDVCNKGYMDSKSYKRHIKSHDDP